MKKFLLMIILPSILCCCKGKKKSLAGNDQVTKQEFIAFFDPLRLPYQLTADSLQPEETDTESINYATFTQFVKDTVLTHHFSKSAKPTIYALGKVEVPGHETYLFIKAATSSRRIAYVLAFDKSGQFVTSKPLIFVDNHSGTGNTAVMDSKYTITITHKRSAADGQVFFKRDTYVFNDAGAFMLIMTESNEVAQEGLQIINPIDTLQHHHKFTGDYAQDKRNFISVRDGKDASHFVFFVHFERDKGECKGELKGIARFISPNLAQYRAGGDPCTLEFAFSPERVSIKELDACGNHRDIKCFFEGSYLKRKELRTKPPKKKK